MWKTLERAQMFYLQVRLVVRQETDIPAVRGALLRMLSLVRQEPGCARFEIYQSLTDPRSFFLVEHWDTRDAWLAHRQMKAVQEIYLPEVLSRADREAHECTVLE
jgi:quinol monooxygenase YgiN